MIRRKNRVKVFLEGGSGNQLFMYFAGLAAATKMGVPLYLETKYVGKFGTDHGSFLNEINIRGVLYENRKINPFSVFCIRILNGMARRLSIIRRFQFRIQRTYQATEIGFDPKVFEFQKSLNLRGYFQSWKYYEYCSAKNVSQLGLIKPSKDFLSAQNKIQESPTIAVHVRRGDYGPLSETFGMLSEEYFVNAVKHLQNSNEEARIWIFSDDINLVKRDFTHSIWANALFTDLGLNPIETIFLMASADAHVISNSSFSYWSALLANKQSRVVAPDTWFRNLEDPKDLLPPEWSTIESCWSN